MTEHTGSTPVEAPAPAPAPVPAPADRPFRPGVATRATAARRRRERNGSAIAGVVVAALACAAVVVLFGGGSAVEVVETGFSVVEDADGRPLVSFGVVVENRTDEVARLTMVRVEIDEEGEDDCCRDRYEFVIGEILPGQRVGVGATRPAPTMRSSASDEPNVAGLDASVHGPAYTSEAFGEIEDLVISAKDTVVSFSPANEPMVSFTTWSHHGTQPSDAAAAYAIFRNADDDIVGGAGGDGEDRGPGFDRQRWSVGAEARLPELSTVEVYAFE